ncbi:MAG TPA: sigma-70 family RNA polymerase sigma factor [Gemmataceae bacterium]|jgi:RNA polymerase sigma factor (sigma-70 family)|nr:sigma-70 family RNA polymerase sigma factor [Gemmataceae bacterium]
MRLTNLLRHLHPVPSVPASAASTDREALRAFVAHKDEAAFTVLVNRHGPMVLAVCRRILHHAQDAEDACQATFLVLARKAASIGRSDALGSWLHGVAYRIALRARRDAGRRRAREQQAATSVGTDPTEAIAWRDVQVFLEAEIARLPERYRAAFVLCHLEGRSRIEAAADLGIEENTLSSRLARARERLRWRLARRGVHLPALLAAAALADSATGSAIPTELVQSTVQAAIPFAARLPVTSVSKFTLQLTNGAMPTMAITKIKWAVGAMALSGVLVAGTWGAGQGPGGPPPRNSDPVPVVEPAEKPAAVERNADYAQRQRSLKNLRAIMLAMHNYHDANGKFPTDITDKTGKPLLSWRVELLPYMEQDNFAKMFNRNEPWDSEHNLKLLSQMPDVFHVGFEPKEATHTYYQRFAIAGGLWGGSGDEGGGAGGPSGAATPGSSGPGSSTGGAPTPPGPMGGVGSGPPPAPAAPASTAPRFPLRMTEITDGTSNTLGLIEAGPPVPWTKPADIVYDAKKPLPPMTGPFANVRNAATLDGATHPLKLNIDEKTTRHLIEPNDGNVVPDFKTLRARFAADSDEEKKALEKFHADSKATLDAIEKLHTESIELLRVYAGNTKDLQQAEETQERLKSKLQDLRALIDEYRRELGLPRKFEIPSKAAKPQK